jgi:hypothetical protein
MAGEAGCFRFLWGISGGLRAVEQLRQVFAELHTVTVWDRVSFANTRDQFDAAGVLLAPEHAEKSMAVILARLHWWRWPCGTRAAPFAVRTPRDRKEERKPMQKKAEIMKKKHGGEHQ